MKSILVSIIIPIYNVEYYLKECIDSVIQQTYNTIEIILVNDGSTDNCPKICDEYALKDSRIKVIHKINGGLSDARNFGIEKANGEYICFVDSDDYVEKNYVEELLASALKYNSDLVICDFIEFDDETLIDPDSSSFYSIETYDNIDFLENILDKVPSHNSAVNVVAWNKLIKKDKLGDLKFRVRMKHEDMFFIHHLIYKTPRISIVHEKLYYYRQRALGISNTNYNINKYHNYLAYKDRRKFYKTNLKTSDDFYRELCQKLLIDLFYNTYNKSILYEMLMNIFEIIFNSEMEKRIKIRIIKDLVRKFV